LRASTRARVNFQSDALMPWPTRLTTSWPDSNFAGSRVAQAVIARASGLVRVGLAGFEDRYPHQLSAACASVWPLAQLLILDPNPADGRAVLRTRTPDPAADGKNELLDLWAANRKSVLFITHDLESDRVVRPRGRALRGPGDASDREFPIDLPRPRDVAENRLSPRFVELHEAIWHVLKSGSAEGLCAGQALTARPAGRNSRSGSIVDPRDRVSAIWYGITTPGLCQRGLCEQDPFFFGRPLQVVKVVIDWFTSGKIYPHLAITLWGNAARIRDRQFARTRRRAMAGVDADRVGDLPSPTSRRSMQCRA